MHTSPITLAQAQTMLERLSPLNQVRVVTGLLAVIVLGIVIFMVIKAGAHMARGLSAAADRLPEKTIPDEDDWARRPLNPPVIDDE